MFDVNIMSTSQCMLTYKKLCPQNVVLLRNIDICQIMLTVILDCRQNVDMMLTVFGLCL